MKSPTNKRSIVCLISAFVCIFSLLYCLLAASATLASSSDWQPKPAQERENWLGITLFTPYWIRRKKQKKKERFILNFSNKIQNRKIQQVKVIVCAYSPGCCTEKRKYLSTKQIIPLKKYFPINFMVFISQTFSPSN